MSVHIEHCMGTVFTIDIRDSGDWADAVDAVVAWLQFVDATFSTYRPDSDVSRIRRGELRVAEAAPEVAEVLDLCAAAQRTTGGFFTGQPDGRLDPTGLVKGWAIERASGLLHDLGSHNHAVNGGGDMQLAGAAGPDRPWTVGISDPQDPSSVLSMVTGRDFAVATSGISERGRHIVNPFTGQAAAAGVLSVTVVGPTLTETDAYATAAFAMGKAALHWVESLAGYEAMVVADGNGTSQTSGWPAVSA